MKTFTVGEVKSKFSEVLDMVQEGEEIYITYGKNKKVVAQIVPVKKKPGKKKRKLGALKGKVKVTFHGDWHMTDEELLHS